MFDNGMIKERLDKIEEVLGKMPWVNPHSFVGQSWTTVHDRLDRIEHRLAELHDWQRRIEQKLGVTEVMNNKQQYQFLSTKQIPVRGYLDNDEVTTNK